MTYSARYSTPDTIERAKAQTLSLYVYDDATIATVSSGTLSVYDSDGNVVVDAEAVTVEGDGSVSYALLAATVPATLSYSTQWREEWTLVIGGVSHTFLRDAHLCRVQLYPVVTQLDLYRRHSDLANVLPASRTTWQHAIDEAWDLLMGRLYSHRRWPYIIVSPWSLREAHLYETLATVFRELALFTNGRGRYGELAKEYSDQADRAWSRLEFTEDTDQDGRGDTRQSGTAPILISAGNIRGSRWRR